SWAFPTQARATVGPRTINSCTMRRRLGTIRGSPERDPKHGRAATLHRGRPWRSSPGALGKQVYAVAEKIQGQVTRGLASGERVIILAILQRAVRSAAAKEQSSGMNLLPTSYSLKHLQRDVLAGLTVASVAVPQAIAYALIAGIKPEYGLYTAIIMTALASLFGSSSHLINGPTNAISLVVFGAIDGLTRGPDDPARIEYVCLLAILVGLIQILIAVLKL